MRNVFSPTVYGVGYRGNGIHKISPRDKTVSIWYSILERCYSENKQRKSPQYIGCSVAEEWHNFQTFADWFVQEYTVNRRGWHLDKDLLVKGNKVYSEATCALLPQELNNVLISQRSRRGGTPRGVSYEPRTNSFRATCAGYGNNNFLGRFATPEEAFNTYKVYKENYVKSVAEKWRACLDPRAYEALMNYTVEITD